MRPDGVEDNAYDEGFVYFDQTHLNMLELTFIHGNPGAALTQPGAIVITKRKADKYFPNSDPVGKLLIVNNQAAQPYTVAGVIEDFKLSVLIALWVQDEYRVNAIHENLDHIYTITSSEYSGHEITFGGYDTPGLLGEELKRVLSEVEYACNYSSEWRTFNVEEKIIKLLGNFTGADFFKIFSYPLLVGSKEAALKTPEV